MFFFIYHVLSVRGRVEVGMSPCPEYDLSLMRGDDAPRMHVISPPMRVAEAYRALEDVRGLGAPALEEAFRAARKSLSGLLPRQPMLQGPVPVADDGNGLSRVIGPMADRMASLVRGRSLRAEELGGNVAGGESSAVAMAAQYCARHHGLEVVPGIMYRSFGGRVCARCGCTSGFLAAECPSCGRRSCLSCAECSSMGAVRECGPIYRLHGGSHDERPSKVHFPVLQYDLTEAQKRASVKVARWFEEGGSDEALVWAVCGAGKTEVSYGAIASALNRGSKVLYAVPRRDVAAELGARIRGAFPGATCSQYYAGSPGRSGRGTEITIATTHQAIRFYRCFDLTVLDEVDAFPYQGSRMLFHAVREARAPGGRTLFMSATPPKDLMEASEEGKMLTATIPARHHGFPLPLPRVIRLGAASKGLLLDDGKELPGELKEAVAQSIDEGNGHFLFVPRKASAEPLCRKVASFMAASGRDGSRAGWAHSADPDRTVKRDAFTRGDLDVLVCTSIMEMGVTVPGVDVSVIGADSEGVFDYRALVQMAGRAGRQEARPTGNVRFFCETASSEMAEAIRIIGRMNSDALENGFLIAGGQGASKG